MISDAQVAQIHFTAFTSYPQDQQIPCRLVVRRVTRLNPKATAQGQGQGELFTTWRYHAFITNSTLTVIDADATHRDHAIIEQVIAELKNGPLAHAPSGSFAANSAWLALGCTAFNIMRAAGAAASTRHAKARWDTLRTHLIDVPARVASTARRLVLHLPKDWPWAPDFEDLWATATTWPPRPNGPNQGTRRGRAGQTGRSPTPEPGHTRAHPSRSLPEPLKNRLGGSGLRLKFLKFLNSDILIPLYSRRPECSPRCMGHQFVADASQPSHLQRPPHRALGASDAIGHGCNREAGAAQVAGSLKLLVRKAAWPCDVHRLTLGHQQLAEGLPMCSELLRKLRHGGATLVQGYDLGALGSVELGHALHNWRR